MADARRLNPGDFDVSRALLRDINARSNYMMLGSIFHDPPRQPPEEDAVAEEEEGESDEPSPSPEVEPYLNRAYDKWRRGLRVWFQVTLMCPMQGYIIDCSTVPVTFR